MTKQNWRRHQRGADEWTPEISFTRRNKSTTPRDYLTRDERAKVRNGSLEYGSVPQRSSVYGEDRDRWLQYLAQRFEKPKEEVTEQDWERANRYGVDQDFTCENIFRAGVASILVGDDKPPTRT